MESVQIFKSLCGYGKETHIRTISDISVTPLDFQGILARAAENLTPEEYEQIVNNTENYNEYKKRGKNHVDTS